MSISACCVKGFEWDGTPEGRIIAYPTASNQAYVAGSNDNAAVMLIPDLFGWRYPNIRLLADHLAREVEATVYVPDFFNGETLNYDALERTAFDEIDLHGFVSRHSREIREPEILACARKLRAEYSKFGAIGYCYGGWAVFRLAAAEHKELVDCVIAGHPSLLTKDDIDHAAAPVQIQAPEIDAAYTAELKEHTFKTLQANGVMFDYQYFPGVEHACLTRGSPKIERERDAMARGKNAAVAWFRQFLKAE
ncbi:uncharacterized protein LTR77_001961 [Saxophila tyrrhenica]|uniref:Dienelactone hydrolase domain-containing protein n=1 Tax=Saxophila tyrrhenica TaxID=1690608 RepID=A0AAV9PKR9_9PEZI|nr:hypothetical protein LTR77_001961 [Saxophila tyrrhenica]